MTQAAASEPRFVMRPIREDDFPALTHLVGEIGHGLTSLPKDPDFLEHRINDSLRAFDPRIRKPGGEIYLFVLEDLREGGIAGTSGLLSRVGGFDPFYTYQVREHTQAYPPLGITTELRTLHLARNHKGPTEICSLFLDRAHRSGGMGKLLSLARFCFMKAFPGRFDHEVLAELRGYIDANGLSPFWEAVGKRFFAKDYYTADILSGIGEKDFIEALMPKYPIYISLLPENAQAVIGRVHPHTEPARRILLNEGFSETDEVDIFDAGPLLKARRESLRTWRAARTAPVAPGRPDGSGPPVLVTNQSLEFRAVMAPADLSDPELLRLSPACMEALRLESGQPAMYVAAS
jgi:arginine N-succinyltransferase